MIRRLLAGPAAACILAAAPAPATILHRPEMRPPAYPFRLCAGDPLREVAAGATETC